MCDRWIENPYFQLFCGEEFFQHKLTFARSSLTRWRQRMGEEKIAALEGDIRNAREKSSIPALRAEMESARKELVTAQARRDRARAFYRLVIAPFLHLLDAPQRAPKQRHSRMLRRHTAFG